jgi:hypothetical protein
MELNVPTIAQIVMFIVMMYVLYVALTTDVF